MSDFNQKLLSRFGAAERRLVRTLAILIVGALAPVWPAAQAQQWAQPPRVHYRWSQEAAPGEIGEEQVRNGVVPPGYFQPVRVLGPEGLRVGIRPADGDEVTQAAPADFALMVGAVYRLRLSGIPHAVGAELFPSIEVIDRLHPPEGLEGRHPIPVHLTQEDLELALTGRMVTKVIYLEQQGLGVPTRGVEGELPTYDTTPEQDALEAADVFGRPVAIVRMGQWVPLDPQWSDDPLGPPPPVIFPVSGPREAAADGAASQGQSIARTLRPDSPKPAMRRDAPHGTTAVPFTPIPEHVVGNLKWETLPAPARRVGDGERETSARPIRADRETGWRRATRRAATGRVALPGKPADRPQAEHFPSRGRREGAQDGWVAVRPDEG